MNQTMVITPGEKFKEELAQAVAEMVLAQISNAPGVSKDRDEFLNTGEVLSILRITAYLRKPRKSGRLRTYGEGTRYQRYRRSEVDGHWLKCEIVKREENLSRLNWYIKGSYSHLAFVN
ncbi:MAG: hypothetical protein IPH31_18720 [Lewinellaceae bacterium]|nr:hypothetical protein [Lewinellaceae bacterium]